MFKPARWRSDKNSIKIVFRLKFHASQAFQFNTEGLTVSLVPGDIGKPTARSEKAVVNDGKCKWEIPVYETVKFVKDTKTGKVNQRIYHLIVSTTTGSSKGGLVGETSIDFGEYANTVKTCNVSLPLQKSNSKALLHVSIQRQSEFDDAQREVDECENVEKMSHGQDLRSHLSFSDANETHSFEEGPFGKAARFAELRRRASIESDSSTMSSSGSVIEPNTPEEAPKPLRHPTTKHLHSAKSLFEEFEWSGGSSDHGDSSNSSNETIAKDNETEKLKNEISDLTRQADLSELELQTLRKQIVKETKRSQDLLKEVNSWKQERDSLKKDSKSPNRLQFEGRDPWILLEENREELDYEKDRNFNLRLQLQKTQESNSELILAVQDLEEMLEGKSKEGADEQLALDYEILKQENHDILYKLEQSQLQEQCSSTLVDVTELENRIKELETVIETLEEEVERQGERFEVDIEAVTRGKVEQEQRAIKAEEALRKTRWKNASVAGKIQEEFKRLSEQMDSMFVANEKMATKAMAEGNDLRMQKRQLEEMLKNANDELSSKTSDIENQNQEMTVLKDEIESLLNDKNSLTLEAENLRAELEENRKSVMKVRKESESLVEELQGMKVIKDEKEVAITHLQTELETLRDNRDDLKHSLLENDLEMEKYKKQVGQVKAELKKKEEAISNLEKKLKESRTAINNLTKAGQRNNNNNNKGAHGGPKEFSVMKDKIKLLEEQIKLKETALEASTNTFIEKENNLKNRIKELETKIDRNRQENEEIRVLAKEAASLRECNESMEMELKEMQERYSEISLRFAEVEGERQQLVMTIRNLKNAKRS